MGQAAPTLPADPRREIPPGSLLEIGIADLTFQPVPEISPAILVRGSWAWHSSGAHGSADTRRPPRHRRSMGAKIV